ncbi:aminopeptidase P family protein [Synechocystis sp. PCC 7509]|uniref:aminopeptidase P family protein n=1 Tax=Synechocystis sp. PCC 7509 TaxID=927677 RepID=UPI0002AC2CD8|nr:aminopeptidase P family protein [Synechocystis sp. PCC 7509]
MTLIDTLRDRRQKLAKLIDFPAILWSGKSTPRNFAANTFPFRASSHFLYFAGLNLENAAIRLENGNLELFMDDPPSSNTLWHGEIPKREEIAERIGADSVYPFAKLRQSIYKSATLPVQNIVTRQQQDKWLQRKASLEGVDLKLASAIAQLRLIHDKGAIAEIKQAANVTVKAHLAGIEATKSAKTEAEVRSAMEQVILAHNMTCAYSSIVTVRGEVLHNNHYDNKLSAGDLLLADVGAETTNGWASDVTRTWAVSGKFSPTQKDIYDVVLAAHDACIAAIAPDVEYQEIHLLAASIIAQGLVNLGILRGNPEDLVAMDAHALFFPHGVGHLLGLDVHDMEDLGDVAGYEAGRKRSDRFGLCYLRLNRPLRPKMVVTIEPGFYQVPAILNNSETRTKYKDVVNWQQLDNFADVRGIRIEDDVLVTAQGSEVLTAQLSTNINEFAS